MSLSYRLVPGAAMRPLHRPAPSPASFTKRCTARSRVAVRYVSSSKLERAMPKVDGLGAKKDPTISEAHRRTNTDSMKQGSVPLFPITFVPTPLSEYPRSPRDFFAYVWVRVKAWTTGLTSVFQVKLQSQEKWTSRPRWKAHRGRIAPTAKAMYRDMLEAFAAGDKETINRLCTPFFAAKMQSALARRPKNETIKFQMKYKKPLFYPKLSSHLIGMFNPFDKHHVREQAVVAIASTQTMSKTKTVEGVSVPAGFKAQDKLEYVAMVRDLNTKTYESTPWQIWGTTTSTTLQQSRDHYETVTKQQRKLAGWKN